MSGELLKRVIAECGHTLSLINKKFTGSSLSKKQTLCLKISNVSFRIIPMTNLKPAIEYFGSLNNVARSLGLNSMAAHQWKKRGLPPERAIQIAKKSNGNIKPSDLIPDFDWY